MKRHWRVAMVLSLYTFQHFCAWSHIGGIEGEEKAGNRRSKSGLLRLSLTMRGFVLKVREEEKG